MTKREARLGAGDIEIVIDGRKAVLQPRIGAGLRLCRHFDDLMGLWSSVAQMDIDAVAYVVGLGLDRTDLEQIAEEVWSTGADALIAPLHRFLAIVAGCGEPLKPDHDEKTTQAEESGEKLMTAYEVYEHWAGVAMGWLGWSERTTMAADINVVRVAFEAKIGMLKMCFGLREVSDIEAESTPRQRVSSRPLTMELFDALWSVT